MLDTARIILTSWEFAVPKYRGTNASQMMQVKIINVFPRMSSIIFITFFNIEIFEDFFLSYVVM